MAKISSELKWKPLPVILCVSLGVVFLNKGNGRGLMEGDLILGRILNDRVNTEYSLIASQ